MAQFIRGNGQLMALGKARGFRSGGMAQNTKDIGSGIRPMAMAELFIRMGIPMLESGRMIRHMVGVLMNTWMALSILVIGSRINSMDMA